MTPQVDFDIEYFVLLRTFLTETRRGIAPEAAIAEAIMDQFEFINTTRGTAAALDTAKANIAMLATGTGDYLAALPEIARAFNEMTGPMYENKPATAEQELALLFLYWDAYLKARAAGADDARSSRSAH